DHPVPVPAVAFRPDEVAQLLKLLQVVGVYPRILALARKPPVARFPDLGLRFVASLKGKPLKRGQFHVRSPEALENALLVTMIPATSSASLCPPQWSGVWGRPASASANALMATALAVSRSYPSRPGNVSQGTLDSSSSADSGDSP